MGQALDSFILEGVTTTIPFLARVIRHPDFVAGDVDTRFLERESQLLRPRRMKLDVVFTPGRPDCPPRSRAARCSSIDILRATTTMCAALHHGAKAHHPGGLDRGGAAPGADDRQRPTCCSPGEKNCVRIPGFHLGNSPLEMTETAVRGKTLIVTTTNGTKALLACQGAGGGVRRRAPPTSRSPPRRRGRRSSGTADVLIVCAGRDGAFSLDDAYCAGRLAAAALGEPQAAPRPQRRGDREPRPGPPLRRALGASAHLQPRGPRAHPAGLPRRRARRGPARCVPRAGAFPRTPGDARASAGMSSDSRRRLGAITALVAGLFVGLTLLPFPVTGPIGHSLGPGALARARRRRARHSRCWASGSRWPASSGWARLDMKRSAFLIVGLSVLLPYLTGVLCPRHRGRSRHATGSSAGWWAWFPASSRSRSPRASAWPARCWRASWRSRALTLATFAWHPLQRLERQPDEPDGSARPLDGERREGGRQAQGSEGGARAARGGPRRAARGAPGRRGREGRRKGRRQAAKGRPAKKPEPRRAPGEKDLGPSGTSSCSRPRAPRASMPARASSTRCRSGSRRPWRSSRSRATWRAAPPGRW